MDVKRELQNRMDHLKKQYKRIVSDLNQKEVLLYFGKGMLWLIYTYLLASTKGLFDTYPFALALLCALPCHISFAFAGAALGALFGGAFVPQMLVGYGVIFLWRTQIKRFWQGSADKEGEEPLYLRTLLSFVAALAVGVAPLFVDFTFYGLFGAFFMAVVCPCMTLVFSGAFLVGRTSILFWQAGWDLLRFCLVYTCLGFSLFGYVPALAVAAWITVLTFAEGGTVSALFSGFFTGLALGMDFAVLFAVMALVGSLAARVQRRFAPGAGLVAAMAYGYATMGSGVLFSVFPDLVCGALLAVPLLHIKKPYSRTKMEEPASAAVQYLDNAERQLHQRQEENTREGLHRLSRMFVALSQDRAPSEEECRELCRERMRGRCEGCKGSAYCLFGQEHISNDVISSASEQLHKKGRAEEALWKSVGCSYAAEISDELALDYAALYRAKCQPAPADAYAAGFEAIARLLAKQNDARRLARRPHTDKARTISQRARRMGLMFSTVGVYGGTSFSVFFCDCKGPDCRGGAEGLRALCEQVLGQKMSEPKIVCTAKGSVLILESRPAVRIRYAKGVRAQKGERVCGDVIHSFEDSEGNPCLLLCDGMGSGVQAAVVAGIGCSLSECMSRAGADAGMITDLLNTTLSQRREEIGCSFDLFTLDRFTAKAVFYKSGAAPTLVLRGGNVYNLSSDSLPLGILERVRAEQTCMQMQAGDLVILVSDGIAADFEDAAALAAMVAGDPSLTEQQLADKVLSRCAARSERESTEHRNDDMSVVVIRIEEEDLS